MRTSKHRIATDVALRDIVKTGFEAGIGLAVQLHIYRCGGSVGFAPNFPFNLALAQLGNHEWHAKHLGAQGMALAGWSQGLQKSSLRSRYF